MLRFTCRELWRKEKAEMRRLVLQGGQGKLKFSYSKKDVKKEIKRKALRTFSSKSASFSSKSGGDVLPAGFESILVEVGVLGAYEYYG